MQLQQRQLVSDELSSRREIRTTSTLHYSDLTLSSPALLVNLRCKNCHSWARFYLQNTTFHGMLQTVAPPSTPSKLRPQELSPKTEANYLMIQTDLKNFACSNIVFRREFCTSTRDQRPKLEIHLVQMTHLFQKPLSSLPDWTLICPVLQQEFKRMSRMMLEGTKKLPQDSSRNYLPGNRRQNMEHF